MVLTAPELIVAELIKVLGELEVTAELQQRVLADGMMRGKEGTKTEPRHADVSWSRTSERLTQAVLVYTWPRLELPGLVLGLVGAASSDDRQPSRSSASEARRIISGALPGSVQVTTPPLSFLKRWIVEWTNGWLSRRLRRVKDRACLNRSALRLLCWASQCVVP